MTHPLQTYVVKKFVAIKNKEDIPLPSESFVGPLSSEFRLKLLSLDMSTQGWT